MRLVLTALVAVMVAAGCGDDSIPLSEYVERANAICRDATEQTSAKLKGIDDGDVTRLERTVVDTSFTALHKIEDLPATDERQDEVSEYERLVRESLTARQHFLTAYEKGDSAGMDEAMERNESRGADVVKAARELGLDTCAGEPR